jgi:hypothetical protein
LFDFIKSLLRDKTKEEKLSEYFNKIDKEDSNAAKLAKRYVKRSREIGLKLVTDNVANSEEDVNKVMLTGFFHLYGPINDFLK